VAPELAAREAGAALGEAVVEGRVEREGHCEGLGYSTIGIDWSVWMIDLGIMNYSSAP
jgi:hypothetical protein